MQSQDILRYLPHRYPLLFIDTVDTLQEDLAMGIKQLTENEWYFQGHFPGRPEMPVSLLLESMGQTGAAAIMARPENDGKILFLAGIDNVDIVRSPVPGETLEMEARLLRFRGDSGRTLVTCRSEGTVVSQAQFTFVLGHQEASP